MRRLLTTCCILLGLSLAARAGEVYVVDCNGGGDFTSVQACFDALPSKPAAWRTVRIMPGTYREKVTLDVYKDKVAILGEEGVRIVWNDYSGRVVDGYELTTYDSWTLSIQADEVYLAGVTVENDAGRVGQAVALETRGDRIWIDRCRLIGDQDTFFTKGYVSRVYVSDSHIEGTTDFIFGPSIVYFRNCSIRCKADSYITAASTTERNRYGYIFDSCRVTADEGVTKLYLGPPLEVDRPHGVDLLRPAGRHPPRGVAQLARPGARADLVLCRVGLHGSRSRPLAACPLVARADSGAGGRTYRSEAGIRQKDRFGAVPRRLGSVRFRLSGRAAP